MISKVSIRNFKCLRDVSVELARFTVFVGPNASGKSSILKALDLLCRGFRPDAAFGFTVAGQEAEKELFQAASRGAKGPVELEAEAGGNLYRYRGGSSATAGIAPAGDPSSWRRWNPEQSRTLSLPSSVLLRLEASKLVDPTPTSPDPTVMAADGTGLHSALASMTLNDPDSWQALQDNLKRIIPTIRRLRHTKAQPTSVLFDTVGADSLPATLVSEGTLLVLGMLAALHASARPNLILLDDLDRGLHPKAQKELIALLRGLLDSNPNLQIAATTHSPYMLDCMGVNEVRMTFLKDDGSTVCAPLTSHPNYPKWKDEMTPGEMWSLFGEKWVAEEVGA